MTRGSPAAVQHRVSVEEAVNLIAAAMPMWPAAPVALADALGGVLREAVIAERDQPPFDRVTMDGIAIRYSSLARGIHTFRVGGTQPAGAAGQALRAADDCIEVMTGSMLPQGADCIVPVERTRRIVNLAVVEPDYAVSAGQFIHRRGTDHRRGDTLLETGTLIGAPEMAVLTIGGKAEVAIGRWPRIAVISTGDELVEAAAPIAAWQIRSSNDRAIEAALRQRGFSQVSRTSLRDDPKILSDEIGRLYASCDALILSGGVSMGQFDLVPGTLTGLGLRAVFHKIMQRPGMPMWFGVGPKPDQPKPVFALPGNPVSSLVCLVRYVLPALFQALGAEARPTRRVKLGRAVEFTPDLTWFLPVQLRYTADGETLATPKETNTSGDFVALAGTDGFVELPRGQDHFPAGYAAKFFAW